MSAKDEAKVLAKQFGGWENLARMLHKHLTLRSDIEKSISAFTIKKRGPKIKRDLSWFFMMEAILNTSKAKAYPDKEASIIEKNLALFYGTKLRAGPARRSAAIKTIQNELAKHRKMLASIRKNYNHTCDITYILANMKQPTSDEEANNNDDYICS